jgi:hypothetical protein
MQVFFGFLFPLFRSHLYPSKKQWFARRRKVGKAWLDGGLVSGHVFGGSGKSLIFGWRSTHWFAKFANEWSTPAQAAPSYCPGHAH